MGKAGNKADGAPVEASSTTSSSLLERVKAQDQDAWRRLVEIYGPFLYRWCRRWEVPTNDIPDIVQEVFRGVVSGLPTFRRDRAGDTFRGWLWTIARNKVRDHLARKAKAPQATGGTSHQKRLSEIPERYPDDIDHPDVARDSVGLLRRALNAIRGDFRERTWQVFWRCMIEGHTTVEVADDLQMTPRAVRQARHRVIRRLRDEFRELADDFGL